MSLAVISLQILVAGRQYGTEMMNLTEDLCQRSLIFDLPDYTIVPNIAVFCIMLVNDVYVIFMPIILAVGF